MGSITIRKLDDRVKEALRIRAAKRGVSMEEEARLLLANAADPLPSGEEFVQTVRNGIDAIGDLDIDDYIPPRSMHRLTPLFEIDGDEYDEGEPGFDRTG